MYRCRLTTLCFLQMQHLFVILQESIPLAWVNTTLFDFQDNLRQGQLKLYAWPVPETMAEQLKPVGTVVSNINTSTSACLMIDFQRYSSNVMYPPFDKVRVLDLLVASQ